MKNLDKTTILNGFGVSLGDSIIGLQALSLALRAKALSGAVVLARNTNRMKPLVSQIYDRAADLAQVVALDTIAVQGRVIDIREFAFDPGFARISMIDFFLKRLSVNPLEVRSEDKRNTWIASRLGAIPNLELPPNYVLICPKASMALRDIPMGPYLEIVRHLQGRGIGSLVTQGEHVEGTIPAPYCDTIEELASLVAGAQAIISTDTAIIHLADSFSVPCLAFMTTHRPEWRVRDYRFCYPCHLPVPGIPESTEFLRGPEDLLAVRKAWAREGEGLTWINAVIDKFLVFSGVLAGNFTCGSMVPILAP